MTSAATSPGGELVTLWTVRVAFALYVAAVAVRLAAARSTRRDRTYRLLWTAGCAAFAVHVVCAFHFYHNWSHADAFAETARQTGALTGVESGFGLYLNYAFLLAWAADAAWAWRPADYAGRRRWVGTGLHVFLAFMWFNATVVFPAGPVRWAGVAGFGLLVGMLGVRWVRRRRTS